MGMYTELVLGVNIKDDTPNEVITVLRHMVYNPNINSVVELPDHPLFATSRWKHMLRSCSYYFSGGSHTELVKDQFDFWKLSIRCNLKNYDDEINKFWNWIQPYVETKGHVGHFRYEEDDEPTLMYN